MTTWTELSAIVGCAPEATYTEVADAINMALAERDDELSMSMRRILHRFVVSWLSQDETAKTSLEILLASAGRVEYLNGDINVSSILGEVYSLPLTESQMESVTDAFYANDRADKAPQVESPVAPPVRDTADRALPDQHADRRVIHLRPAG